MFEDMGYSVNFPTVAESFVSTSITDAVRIVVRDIHTFLNCGRGRRYAVLYLRYICV